MVQVHMMLLNELCDVVSVLATACCTLTDGGTVCNNDDTT